QPTCIVLISSFRKQGQSSHPFSHCFIDPCMCPRDLPAPDDGRALLNTTRVHRLFSWPSTPSRRRWSFLKTFPSSSASRTYTSLISTKAMCRQSELAINEAVEAYY